MRFWGGVGWGLIVLWVQIRTQIVLGTDQKVAVRLITGWFRWPGLGRQIASEGGWMGSRSPSSVWKTWRFRFHVFQHVYVIFKICKDWSEGSRSFSGACIFRFHDSWVFPVLWSYDTLKKDFDRVGWDVFLTGKTPLPGNHYHRGLRGISCNFQGLY